MTSALGQKESEKNASVAEVLKVKTKPNQYLIILRNNQMSTDNGFEDILVRAVRNIYSVKLCQVFCIDSFVLCQKIFNIIFLLLFRQHYILCYWTSISCMFLFCFLWAMFLKVFCISENTSITTEKCEEIYYSDIWISVVTQKAAKNDTLRSSFNHDHH